MSEFPRNPTKRERERQQAISTVISGLAYTSMDCAIDPDFVPEDAPISGMQDVALEAGVDYILDNLV